MTGPVFVDTNVFVYLHSDPIPARNFALMTGFPTSYAAVPAA